MLRGLVLGAQCPHWATKDRFVRFDWPFSTTTHSLCHWSHAAWVVGAVVLATTSAPAIAAAPSGPRPESAAPPAEPPAPAERPPSEVAVAPPGLRVEVDPAIDDAALLPRWIADRHPRLALASRDPEGAQAQRVIVQIAGSTYDYRVSITAMRGSERLGATTEPARCECTTEELLAFVDEGILAASERLRPPPSREPEAETSVARPEPEPPEPSRERPERDAPRRGRLGTLGHAGIGVSSMGAGMAIAGISLALRPDEIHGEPGSLEIVSTRRVGIGLSASGGVVLGTGLALLIVDVARAAHRRPGALAIAPFGGPHRLGLSLTRRF